MKHPSIIAAYVALLLAFFAYPLPTSAENWPEFRGPTAQGHSSALGLPTGWSPTKNVLWKAPLPGRAWSSPIVIGDLIYLTNAVGAKDSTDPHDTFSLRVLALNAADGKVLWDTEVFRIEQPHTQGIHGKNSYASPTPIYEDGRIYAHFGHLGTACVDEAGRIVWQSTALSYKPVHGNGGCPVLVDNLLIFNCDAAAGPFVAALEKSSGALRWKSPRVSDAKKSFSFCTPLVITVNGQKQVISPGSNVITALNPKDGAEIWRVGYEGYSVVPRPIFGHGLVFMSTGFDHASVLAIKPDGKGDVTDTHVAWRLDKGAPLTPSLLLIGEDLYAVSDQGIVSCVDARTGAVRWQERVARATSASPLYADGKIYIQDELGSGYVLKPGPKLELLAKNDLGEKSLASYAVWQNTLLIRTQSALWCIGAR
ncbi:MAG: PQQ-binding-like beta-propeller repeat protein [Roseimicrobium sp.]